MCNCHFQKKIEGGVPIFLGKVGRKICFLQMIGRKLIFCEIMVEKSFFSRIGC